MNLIYEYSNYTLKEIEKINNETLRNSLLLEYQQNFESTYENSILKSIMQSYYGDSLDNIYQKLEEIKKDFLSFKLFPGEFVKFYPWQATYKSKNCFVDDLGIVIYPNTYYVCYRPLLWNLEKKNNYVLKKSMKVEVASSDILPNTLEQFEELEEKILNYEEEPYQTLRKKYDTGFTLKKLKHK